MIRHSKNAWGYFWVILFVLTTFAAFAANPKRVVILSPFGKDVAPFNGVVSAFRTTLIREMGEPVEIQEISLELALPGPGGEGPLVKFVEDRITGSLDTATAPELERQLAPVLAGPVKDIVFDLAQLEFISSAGLRVFSTTRKVLRERGGQTSYIHLQPQIKEVFEIIRSLPGVEIFIDIAELDNYLAKRQRSYTQNQ